MAARTLQEFLQFFKWDHGRVNAWMQQYVMDLHGSEQAIGVLDPSAHAKRSDKTPGVQRQWCGEAGKAAAKACRNNQLCSANSWIRGVGIACP